MKHLKKFASLLLAMLMVMSLSANAFAAGETGTITVDNPKEGETYTAYKIFDVTYTEDKKGFSYTLAGDSEWFDVLTNTNATTGEVTSNITGLTFTKAANENTYVVSQGSDFSAASFANTLKENTTDKTGIALEGATVDDKAVKQKTGLDLGYYFVDSSTGALCNLTTTKPTTTIHDKNDIPFDKVDDKESVEIGEVVNYVITGKVPDTTGFETYKYEITDTMSTGLTFNNDVKVYIDGVELKPTEAVEGETVTNYTLTTGTEAGEKDFVLNIDVMKLTVGAKIEVKYSATVNEDAVAKVEKNHAILEYSNNPTDASETSTREDEETVYSAKIVIHKYDAADNTKNLKGAKFVLMNSDKTAYYYYNESANDVEWNALAENEKLEDVLKEGYTGETKITEVETDINGAAEFKGLKDGVYYLMETEAPAGYNLLDHPVEVKVEKKDKTENGKTVIDETTLTATKGVENNTGTVLPETGGIGTTIFYIAGGAMVLAAVVLLVTKKRMAAAK